MPLHWSFPSCSERPQTRETKRVASEPPGVFRRPFCVDPRHRRWSIEASTYVAIGDYAWTSADMSSTGAKPMCENWAHKAAHIHGCVEESCFSINCLGTGY